MKTKRIILIIFAFVTTLLLYHQYWGLNALIIAFGIVTAIIISQTKIELEQKIKSTNWWLALGLVIGNGFASFYIHNQFCETLFFISLLYFSAVNSYINHSLIIGIPQGIYSQFKGILRITEKLGLLFQKKENTTSPRIGVKILIYLIPLLIALLFLKLYQAADPTFYKWTKFINLDWVSAEFLFLLLVVFFVSYGLLNFNRSKHLTVLDEDCTNHVPINYADKAQTFFGLSNEVQIARSTLIILTLLLLLYNSIDLIFIFSEVIPGKITGSYSELIHNGVDALIFSIVLVILLISFLFRGQLNYKGPKYLKSIASLWMVLNLIMVVTTSVKNYEYIAHWGLTYKRIGVFIYLFLASCGLVFTLIKINYNKSFWYLVRQTTLSFFCCFTLMGFINWDKHIAQYNLKLPIEAIDFNYLHKLGKDTYPLLLDYYIIHKNHEKIKSQKGLWNTIFNDFDFTRKQMKNHAASTNWPSLVWREHQLLKKMNTYKLIYKKRFNRYSY
ncbi:DUF4153 domain-containing protein [Crocinitomix algicola]|uniref:DUF4153 domain-containing protein n=1 Tax=Crocinitomix algicola TaxID=1740263 RepID=UPI000831C392|nr:DUF4173 domain-containing protein [Crocinitomix algicola]